MNKKELMEELDKLEIEYDPKAKKDELEALLPEEEEEEEEEEEVEEEEVEEEEEEDRYAGKMIGKARITILSAKLRTLNGRELYHLDLANATTMLLSKDDIEKQLAK